MQLRPTFSVLGVLIAISTQHVEALQVPGSKRDMITLPLKHVQYFPADIDAQVVSKRNTIFTAHPQVSLVLCSSSNGT
jgi:hypothetical protein